MVGAVFGEPDISVRPPRDPTNAGIRSRNRKLAQQKAACRHPADAVVAWLADPEVAVGTHGDAVRTAIRRCRKGVAREHAVGGHLPDLVLRLVGDPEVPIRPCRDGDRVGRRGVARNRVVRFGPRRRHLRYAE